MIGAVFPILVLYSRKKIPESPYWVQYKYGKSAGEDARDKFEVSTGYSIENLPEIKLPMRTPPIDDIPIIEIS